jgi:hypothetical protein
MAWAILENGSQCLFECLEVGQVVKEGGRIESLVPFCTSNKKVCVVYCAPWFMTRLRYETVTLWSGAQQPLRPQRIGVYFENMAGVPYSTPLFTFEGNTRLDLVAAIHTHLAHMGAVDCSEYSPTIYVYTKRAGIAGRHMIGPVLPADCDAVYVMLR